MSTGTRERQRLDAIERLKVLDRVADPALQGLMRLAAYVSGSESAGLHIIDERWQRRIAGHGVPLLEHPREDSFCRLVVESDEPINTPDATGDDRFSYSSFVDGDEPVRFYASVPLRAGGGHVIGTVCAFDSKVIDLPPERMDLLDDIALQATTCIEMATLIDDLGTAATEDSLTGVANRLILADRLSHHIARRERRTDRDLAVAVIDLDRFKQINDSLGHAAGDEVLRITAARIDESLRSEDTVARLGGDEFVVIAESDGTPIEPAELEERLCAAITKEIELESGQRVTPGASIGVAMGKPGDDSDSLLARADEAMYRRKRSGR